MHTFMLFDNIIFEHIICIIIADEVFLMIANLKSSSKHLTENVEKTTICELKLDEANVKHFKEAIDNNYWFEFFMDDLPLWGFVGELHSDTNSDNMHMIFTHKNISLQYNKGQIIHVNLTQENPKPLEVGKTLDMTYSVEWTETNITFACHFDVYLNYHFFEHQIH
ncbi:unnamed protein product [Lactuca saligna]|uniref:Transmembrane 9 superfamily member n=1 Tax=Lactuca saligna TaxID=75948 RepID=A0AA36A349_LACSI|nr:unnamed protein product [Lactuca saligna]